MKTSIGCTGIITTPDTTTSTFILAPGYTYKCACVLSCNQLVSSNIYYWWTTNNTTIGLFGVPAQAYNINIQHGINNTMALGYISPTTQTTVSVVATFHAGQIAPQSTIEVI